MKNKLKLLLILSVSFLGKNLFAQKIPLVYEIENMGANLPKPVFQSIENLPTIEPLPDPFAWSDGSGRDTTFESWERRRNEIGAEIEHYEIGEKPSRPDTITASYTGGILTVNVTQNGKTLVMTSKITLPEGNGPFPAVIGMGGGTGSLPAEIFSSRKIATIAFNFSQVMAWGQKRGSEPINKLYPDHTYMGAYSAWSWGVSRLIDGLELVQSELPIDLKHLALTGCSFAGKMALFAGAFDERIALIIAQESGGGGAAAWRVSETLGNVETLGKTSHVWFMESMFQFANAVPKLPFDHHELMAMIAPRALLVLGNPDYEWLADESGYVSCKAAQRVWDTFGISDRFGYSIVAGHSHCMLPDIQKPDVSAFVEKFLLGNTAVNTNIEVDPYANVDFSRWTKWWGTGKPGLPKLNLKEITVLFEAECATVGGNWDFESDAQASNGSYVTVKTGKQSLKEAPADSASAIYFPFTVETDGNFYVYARLNCKDNQDSFWLKMDNGAFSNLNGIFTNGWEWKKLNRFALKAGEHTFEIALRKDGVKLDKISISNYLDAPVKMGDTAQNICKPAVRRKKAQ